MKLTNRQTIHIRFLNKYTKDLYFFIKNLFIYFRKKTQYRKFTFKLPYLKF
jgi:hypothetical protein